MVAAFDDDDVEASDDASEMDSEGLAATENGIEEDARDGDGDSDDLEVDGGEEYESEDEDEELHGDRGGRAAPRAVEQAVPTSDTHLDQELLLLDGPAAREENLLQLQVIHHSVQQLFLPTLVIVAQNTFLLGDAQICW